MTRIKLYNLLLVFGLSILLAGAAYFGDQVYVFAKQQQTIKQDYSLANSVSLGLFSVDQWRDKFSEIFNGHINGYSITPQQKRQIQAAVEKELHSLVAKTVAEIDKPQKTFGGKLKRLAFRALVDSDSLQRQVRPFAITIVKKVSSPASQRRLKGIALSKANQLEEQTYDATTEANEKITKYLYKKYGVADLNAFDKAIHDVLESNAKLTVKNACYMLACVLAALLLWIAMRKKAHLQVALFVMAVLFAAVLLMVGLTSPVIELDARLKTVDLAIMGEHVSFQNQVLFFQSKSIWGIITTLLNQQKPDAVAVGVIIMLFIVLLPFIRLTAKGLHMFVKNNKVINYLAFEASKWDMADVMIIGMLMTYIGLNGILKSQLANLNIHNDTLTTETVNYTSLQPAYFIFTGYVVFELVLSYILKRMSPQPAKRRHKTRVKKEQTP